MYGSRSSRKLSASNDMALKGDQANSGITADVVTAKDILTFSS